VDPDSDPEHCFPQEKISPNKSPLLSSCRYSEVMTSGKKKIREHSPH
jgi:hypothetical protein